MKVRLAESCREFVSTWPCVQTEIRWSKKKEKKYPWKSTHPFHSFAWKSEKRKWVRMKQQKKRGVIWCEAHHSMSFADVALYEPDLLDFRPYCYCSCSSGGLRFTCHHQFQIRQVAFVTRYKRRALHWQLYLGEKPLQTAGDVRKRAADVGLVARQGAHELSKTLARPPTFSLGWRFLGQSSYGAIIDDFHTLNAGAKCCDTLKYQTIPGEPTVWGEKKIAPWCELKCQFRSSAL